MKKYLLLILTSVILLGSCQKDDLSWMQEIESIKAELANQKKLIEALQANANITGIETNGDSYTIKFSNGQSITLTNGKTPLVTIGDNGNWFINGEDTGCPSRGEDGNDGVTPAIEIVDGHWWINGKDTGIKAEGKDGMSAPYITQIIDHFITLTFCFSDETQIQIRKQIYSKLSGKRILAIGDSQLARQGKGIPSFIVERTGAFVRTHAKGGIGLIPMVDGDGTERPSLDPDNFGIEHIYRLEKDDVKDIDIIFLFGAYNELDRSMDNYGSINDYGKDPSSSYLGRLNYVISRIFETLKSADNYDCKVVLISPHCFGGNWYSKYTGYNAGEAILKGMKEVSEKYCIPYIDVLHNVNINEFNWDEFHNGDRTINNKYLPYNPKEATWDTPSIFPNKESLPSSAKEGVCALVKDSNPYGYTIHLFSNSEWSRGHYAYFVEEDGTTYYPYIYHYTDLLHLNTKGLERVSEYIISQLENLV